MNNPHRINQAYADYFQSWFIEHMSLGHKAYFVTLTFEHEAQRRQRREAEGLSLGSFEMNAFDHLYNRLSRKLIGRNYHRKSYEHRLPHVATFLDAKGSRHWRSLGDLTDLHFHSVWIVENSNTDMFEQLMTLNGPLADVLRNMSFDEIDVRQLHPNDQNDFQRVIGYASKLTGFNNQSLSLGRDFEIYPSKLSDTQSISA